MQFELPDNRLPLSRLDYVPQHLQPYAVRDAQYNFISFEEGELLDQVILGMDYSLWTHHGWIKESITLRPAVREGILTLLYIQSGPVKWQFYEKPPSILHGGQYYLFYAPPGDHEAEFRPGFYEFFQLIFHPHHLVEVARQYPVFEPMVSKAQQGLQNGNQHLSSRITPEVEDIIQQILHSKMGRGERSLFIQSRVRDLLRIYIADQERQRQLAEINNRQKRILLLAEQYIDEHLNEDLSVRALAAQVKVSRAWLQKLFSVHRNQPVHFVVHTKRMQKAKHLLIYSNDQVSEIAMSVSTVSFTSFSTSFKKHTGLSPAQFRKLYRHYPKK